MNDEEMRRLKDKGPYDQTLENHVNMYDKIPFSRDISVEDYDTKTLTSGNIIKYYRCKLVDKLII